MPVQKFFSQDFIDTEMPDIAQEETDMETSYVNPAQVKILFVYR